MAAQMRRSFAERLPLYLGTLVPWYPGTWYLLILPGTPKNIVLKK